MDYDKTSIADTYDAGRDYAMAEKLATLSFFADYLRGHDVRTVIDLGCGTGRFSQALQTLFDADVVGVEPSTKMLDVARMKAASDRVTFHQGSAELIPLSANAADVVFMSMVLHHVDDVAVAARECARVLRKCGHVCVRNTMLDEVSSYPYLRYFPSIGGIIGAALLSRTQLIEAFSAAGLSVASHQIIVDEIAPNWHAFADKLALRADSFVARLPDHEFHAGLKDIRDVAATADETQRVELNIDHFAFQKRSA